MPHHMLSIPFRSHQEINFILPGTYSISHPPMTSFANWLFCSLHYIESSDGTLHGSLDMVYPNPCSHLNSLDLVSSDQRYFCSLLVSLELIKFRSKRLCFLWSCCYPSNRIYLLIAGLSKVGIQASKPSSRETVQSWCNYTRLRCTAGQCRSSSDFAGILSSLPYSLIVNHRFVRS